MDWVTDNLILLPKKIQNQAWKLKTSTRSLFSAKHVSPYTIIKHQNKEYTENYIAGSKTIVAVSFCLQLKFENISRNLFISVYFSKLHFTVCFTQLTLLLLQLLFFARCSSLLIFLKPLRFGLFAINWYRKLDRASAFFYINFYSKYSTVYYW